MCAREARGKSKATSGGKGKSPPSKGMTNPTKGETSPAARGPALGPLVWEESNVYARITGSQMLLALVHMSYYTVRLLW